MYRYDLFLNKYNCLGKAVFFDVVRHTNVPALIDLSASKPASFHIIITFGVLVNFNKQGIMNCISWSALKLLHSLNIDAGGIIEQNMSK